MGDDPPRPLLRSMLPRTAGRRGGPAHSGLVPRPPAAPQDALLTAEPYVPRWVALPEPTPRTAGERAAWALRRYGFPLAAAAVIVTAGLLVWLAPTPPAPGAPVPLPPELRGASPTAPPALRALTVETFPDGAAVSVDGLPLGFSPLRTPTLTADVEAIAFHVEKAGYRPLDTLVAVAPGVAGVQFTLVPLDEPFGAEPFAREDPLVSGASAPAPVAAAPRTAPAARTPARAVVPLPAVATPAPAPAEAPAEAPAPPPRAAPAAAVPAAPTPAPAPAAGRAYGTVHVFVRTAAPGAATGTTRSRGERVYSGDLPAGRQRIRLTHPTLGTWEQDVVVRAGEEQTVYVDVRPATRQD